MPHGGAGTLLHVCVARQRVWGCENPRVGSGRDVCRAQVQLVFFGRACGRRDGVAMKVKPKSLEAVLTYCCCRGLRIYFSS